MQKCFKTISDGLLFLFCLPCLFNSCKNIERKNSAENVRQMPYRRNFLKKINTAGIGLNVKTIL